MGVPPALGAPANGFPMTFISSDRDVERILGAAAAHRERAETLMGPRDILAARVADINRQIASALSAAARLEAEVAPLLDDYLARHPEACRPEEDEADLAKCL